MRDKQHREPSAPFSILQVNDLPNVLNSGWYVRSCSNILGVTTLLCFRGKEFMIRFYATKQDAFGFVAELASGKHYDPTIDPDHESH